MPQAVALFDMDDTLVGANTAALYFAERRRRGEITRRQAWRVGAAWIGYRLNAIDMARLIRQGAAAAQGASEAEMIDCCDRIYREQVQPRILPAAIRALQDHRDRGDAVAIVTASTPYIARPLARELGVEVVMSTELQVGDNGQFTGLLVGEPCFGSEKVNRAQAFAAAHGVDLQAAWFYTDSHTDLPLLNAVGHPQVVRPDFRLRWAARLAGFGVVDADGPDNGPVQCTRWMARAGGANRGPMPRANRNPEKSHGYWTGVEAKDRAQLAHKLDITRLFADGRLPAAVPVPVPVPGPAPVRRSRLTLSTQGRVARRFHGQPSPGMNRQRAPLAATVRVRSRPRLRVRRPDRPPRHASQRLEINP